jgi:hypothetical protein
MNGDREGTLKYVPSCFGGLVAVPGSPGMMGARTAHWHSQADYS